MTVHFLSHFWETFLCCVITVCQCYSSYMVESAPFLMRYHSAVVVFLDSLGCICCTWWELTCPVWGRSLSLPPSETATTTTKSKFRGRSFPTALENKKKERPLLYLEVCVRVCLCVLAFCSVCVSVGLLIFLWFAWLLWLGVELIVHFSMVCVEWTCEHFFETEMSGAAETMQNANLCCSSCIQIWWQLFICVFSNERHNIRACK